MKDYTTQFNFTITDARIKILMLAAFGKPFQGRKKEESVWRGGGGCGCIKMGTTSITPNPTPPLPLLSVVNCFETTVQFGCEG
jgi:hypothetical protein